MANKTIEIDDKTYEIAPLTFGQGKELFTDPQPGVDINTPLLRYSLNNADGKSRTDAEIEALPYPDAMKVIGEALVLNGLRKVKVEASGATQGEEQPAPAAGQ